MVILTQSQVTVVANRATTGNLAVNINGWHTVRTAYSLDDLSEAEVEDLRDEAKRTDGVFNLFGITGTLVNDVLETVKPGQCGWTATVEVMNVVT